MKRLLLVFLMAVVLTGCSSIDTYLQNERVEAAGPVPDGWRTHVDKGSGLSFAYPTGWTLEATDLAAPGTPADWPVVSGWLLMPADVAEALAEGGEPDPNAPVVPPFNIEVVSGDRAALERVYPLTGGEESVYGDNEATVTWMEPGYRHFVFAHPSREEWVVVTDRVTEYPGREGQAEAAAMVLEPLLNSLSFGE